MDYFCNRDGRLYCEEVDVHALADEFGTPLYVYSKRTFLEHFDRVSAAFAPLGAMICYSVKSCHNLSILKLLAERGSAFDVVSGGELRRVIEAGGDPRRVVFAGVGKRDDEVRLALDTGIECFNVESEEELENIAAIALANHRDARLALRVNPDVDPRTHEYTTTGKQETKFGVDLERAARVFDGFPKTGRARLDGLHLHIGSPVNSVQPYVDSISRILELVDRLRAGGHEIRSVNIGGGFGAHYDGSEAPAASVYAESVVPLLKDQGLSVQVEPGRCIAGNAGVLLTRALYSKASGRRRFLIVDAALTELIRPALYGAFHFVWPAAPAGGLIPPTRTAALHMEGTEMVDVVGPVCESGDFLAKDRWLPPVARGDLICVYSAGAYGAVMSSQYNSRPRAAEILVDGASATLIRRRETYDDLVNQERVGLQLAR